MKIIAVVLLFAASPALAQQQDRTHYDASGRVVGKSAIDSQSTVIHYDADGKTLTRESVDSGGVKTIFDAKTGSILGRYTTTPQR